MRDLIVLGLVAVGTIAGAIHPYLGVLCWTWVSTMNPHRLTWGFAYDFPVALVVAGGTMMGLVLSKDKKRFPTDTPIVVLILLILWMCVTSVFAIYPDQIWEMFGRVMKIMLMIVVSVAVLNTRKHLDLLVWVLVASLGFYGVKGGLFTVATGGSYRVWGPPGSFIEGNNEVALALVMIIPLMRYLQMTVAADKKWVWRGLLVAMVLTAVASLGSQSRGALLALSAMGGLFWWRSERKGLMAVVIVCLAVGLVAFMPETWEARMLTIGVENADSSILGRFNAWWMAWNLAVDRPIGGGFEIITPELFARYAPNPADIHAAHSIYFQILGEHGFPGLLLFLMLWWLVWRWGGRLYREGARSAEQQWARHLGGMIQVSLIGYLVGGLFLSLAYFDLPYNLLVLAVVGRHVLDGMTVETKPSAASNPALAATGRRPAA